MYSEYLQQYIADISARVQVDPVQVQLLQHSATCMIGAWGGVLGARTEPPADFLTLSLQLLLLDEGLAALPSVSGRQGADYLVGLGLEQSGEMIARERADKTALERGPLENDHWYRLALAYLHYLAGGHTIQAVSVLRHLERIAGASDQGAFASEYRDAQDALKRIRRQAPPSSAVTDWELAMLGAEPGARPGLRRVSRLARRVLDARQRPLAELGRGAEASWLTERGIDQVGAAFWADYLRGLERRGVTALGSEQAGSGGVDSWLRSGTSLLVVLPTGAGKTIVGELRTALTLAERKHVLWMLPTRALVRQTRRELRDAFRGLGVRVQELPITDDYLPPYTDRFGRGRLVAVTTPEKIMGLLRVAPGAVQDVGLVVLDEAQMLQSGARGTTAELALHQLHARVPGPDVILMTAWHETVDTLERLLGTLADQATEVISSSRRPTRQMCGVLTDELVEDRRSPIVLLYPPGIQSESSTTDNPIALHLNEMQLRSRDGPLAIAAAFASCAARSPLLTVVFAQQKAWTESNANKIAAAVHRDGPLPQADVARLRVELGRESCVEATLAKGVAPHHAGLTALEQHLVEKWVRNGLVRTVVATPTLAQGVNLPFDVSVVTFGQRFDSASGSVTQLDRSEIMNMLGRAGRAGHISDGICLVALPSVNSPPVRVLDSQRRLFFGPPQPPAEYVGLARLILLAAGSGIERQDWLEELSGLGLPEVQTLLAFVIQGAGLPEGERLPLESQVIAFPSVEGIRRAELEDSIAALEQLVDNLLQRCGSDRTLLAAAARTGMPVEILEAFLSDLRSAPERLRAPASELMLWADERVLSALTSCSHRRWCADLLEDAQPTSMFDAISLWRAGASLNNIESSWRLYTGARDQERSNRIKIGAWLNHKLPLVAQLWGALGTCARMEQGTHVSESSGIAFLELLSAFVREGVSSVHELDWLYSLGGLDRVLAHSLASLSTGPVDPRVSRARVRSRLVRWSSDRQVLEDELEEPIRSAVESVLEDAWS